MKYQHFAVAEAVFGLVTVVVLMVLWPGHWTSADVTFMVLAFALTAAALAFPLKVSPQASASLGVAPLFMVALLLWPGQAVVLAVAGSLTADIWLRRRPLVAAFNAGVAAVATGLSSAVFHSLPSSGHSLLVPQVLPYAAVAGLVLHGANLSAMVAMVSLRKGGSFWAEWRRTWALDTVQEGGALVLGFLAAVLAQDAWWAVLLLTAPLGLAYVALNRSVTEARENIKLARQLQSQMKELKATQAQLIQSAKMASVGTLAAGVAHEINNPLFSILGRAEMLSRNAEEHLRSERAREYVRSIQEMAQRASNIVHELLAYSRANGTLEQVAMTKVLDVALDLTGKEVCKNGARIEKHYSEVPPVQGMASKLQQVFVNLLLNARDAMPQGGVITLSCWSEDGWVKVSVKDTGVGIPKTIRHRLFEPFVTTKEVGQGTGLGLYVCHRIVTEHGGRISIKSEEHRGTEVLVELPAVRSAVEMVGTPG